MILDRSTIKIACACRRCGATWHEALDVTEWTDSDGFTMSTYTHDGVNMPNPFHGSLPCPTCSGLRVDVEAAGDPPAQPPAPQPPAPRPSTAAGTRADGHQRKPWDTHRQYSEGPPFRAC